MRPSPPVVEEKVLTDEDMPPLASLDENSDYSGFLSPGVSEALRRRALRKLFSSAVFNVPDGLDDYDDDFTSFAALGDIVTADMKHQAEMEAERAKQAQARAEPATGTEEGLDAAEDEPSEPAAHAGAPADTPEKPDEVETRMVGSTTPRTHEGVSGRNAAIPVAGARTTRSRRRPPALRRAVRKQRPAVKKRRPREHRQGGAPGSMSEMGTGDGAFDGGLPATTTDGAARARALAQARSATVAPTGLVTYASSGRLAIIGPTAESSPVAERIGDALESVLVAPPGDEPGAGDSGGARVIHAAITEVEGHLGAFTLRAEGDGAPIVVAPSPLTGGKPFDIVIDLRPEPALAHEILPPGYFAPRGDRAALAAAIEQATDLVGEFEKPRYFGYDPDICAHGASGIRGCTRCLDACPTGAIRSIGERVEVDPYLCQGAGVCASACPTGAITYAYPPPEGQLAALRAALVAYREAGGHSPTLLFHDAEAGAQGWARVAREAPEAVIPWEVEEIGSVGMDAWTACIAWGARVVLFVPEQVPESVRRELDAQIGVTRAILESMGYAPALLTLLADDRTLGAALASEQAPAAARRRRSRHRARSAPTSVSRSITSTNTHGCVPTSPISRPPHRSAGSRRTVTPAPCAWRACPCAPRRPCRRGATSRASRSSR